VPSIVFVLITCGDPIHALIIIIIIIIIMIIIIIIIILQDVLE
jgi:hypothetical protein